MEYNFTDEQKAIVDTAREIGEKFIKPIRMEADEHEKFPWSVVDELRKADLFGVYIHPNYGSQFGIEGVIIAGLCMSSFEWGGNRLPCRSSNDRFRPLL